VSWFTHLVLLDRNRLDGLIATLKRGCMDGIDADHESVMKTSHARKRHALP
jgi:hypothetical protein